MCFRSIILDSIKTHYNLGVLLTMSKYESLWKYIKENKKDNYILSYEKYR